MEYVHVLTFAFCIWRAEILILIKQEGFAVKVVYSIVDN
jgi:hypothetical protein